MVYKKMGKWVSYFSLIKKLSTIPKCLKILIYSFGWSSEREILEAID